MIEPNEKKKPSRALKATAAVASGVFWSLLAAWLCLLTAWCAIHGWIVPRVADFRPRIEVEASRLLGAPVRIGNITARADWLLPSFSLSDVELQDAQGRTALRLPLVVAALSPRSLLRLGFEQLYLERPELDARRRADGRIVVAGQVLPATHDPAAGSRGADWLFSQSEIVVRHGRLRWTDEQSGAEPLELQAVELLLQNSRWRHALRLQASPPAEHGERFEVVGRFSQPLLALRPGDWQSWQGPLHLDLPRVALAPLYARLGEWLRRPLPTARGRAPSGPLFGLHQAAGQGRLRAWLDMEDGGIQGATVDLAFDGLDLRFAAAPEPLALRSLSGRVSGHRDGDSFDLATRGLALSRAGGDDWPGGDVSLRHLRAAPGRPARTELAADRLDLGALAALARGLPLQPRLQRLLAERAPGGWLESLQAQWQDDPGAEGSEPPTHYRASGRFAGLTVAARPADASQRAAAAAVEAALRAQDPQGHRHVHPPIGQPGVRGADVDFAFDQTGGRARLAMRDGDLEFPGVFEEPRVPLARLGAELRWQRGADGRLAVQVPSASFANADAAGEFRAAWHTDDDDPAGQRMPGVLDLSGSLSRADATRVHRYLPQSIGPEVRHYVRDAIGAGRASAARFQVRGDLRHMPFDDPSKGLFQIAAQLHDVSYAYAPPRLEGDLARPWPALVRLDGELLFEGAGMRIRQARGRLESPASMQATAARGAQARAPRGAATPALQAGAVQLLRAEARIPDLAHAVVQVQARARGPLGEMLDIVNAAPLAGLTEHALAQASATGNAELQLGLSLPIAEIRRSTVRGSLTLAGNDLRIVPRMPLLAEARGSIEFTEQGFSLADAGGRLLGGDVRIEGGLRPLAQTGDAAAAPAGPATPDLRPAHVLDLRAVGRITAEGLREDAALGAVARLAQAARGGTAYTASFGMREGHPELSIRSSLQGLALTLPAPLGKDAEAVLPLRFENRLLPTEASQAPKDELSVGLGEVLAVRYLRALDGEQPQVLAGHMALGSGADGAAPLPRTGVSAQVRLPALDVDAWRGVLRQVAEQPGTAPATATAAAPVVSAAAARRSGSADYLPDTLQLHADTLTAAGRTLHEVAVEGSHGQGDWRARVQARELAGRIEYRQSPARLFARLERLHLPDTAAGDVEAMSDGGGPGAAEAGSAGRLPALDIVVDSFQLKDRPLGRLEVQALHQDQDWLLDRLQLTLPEASFSARGRWGRRHAGAARRTELDFRLDLRDSGALLSRFGMPGVIARGSGSLQGRLDWPGSPFAPDYSALDGALRLDVGSGQFLKADPGLAKLLGVLSLQALPRRLTLDFRDVFSDGFAFDHIRGDVQVNDGIAHTQDLEMKGVAAAVYMDGSADIRRETQDLKVLVVPDINAGTASILATMVNPVIGLSTLVAQAVLRGPLNRAATQQFEITGRWDDPKIVRQAAAAR